MTKGDEYADKMEAILLHLYEEGAIGLHQTVSLEVVQEKFGLEHQEALSVMGLLVEQGKVAMPVPGQYRLTGGGFEEAQNLSKAKGSTWVRGAAG